MIILASKSPRRKELLKLITEDFTTKSTEVDETLPEGITPSSAVLYLSEVKAKSISSANDIVIGADTVVAVGSEILGKPKNEAEAKEMLTILSGKTHSVYTGVTIIAPKGKESFFCETKVEFFELSEKEIDNYIKTGEPMDKAGAYAIQGFGSLFVKRIEGDFFNVVGLPVSALNKALKSAPFCLY